MSASSVRLLFLLGLLLAGGPGLHAQKSRSSLEAEKAALQRKISSARQILDKTLTQKTTSLDQLRAVSAQMASRQEYLRSIQREVEYADKDIKDIHVVVQAMQLDLERLRTEYAHMIYYASKLNNSYNELAFLFSAESFHELRLRIKYLGDLTRLRREQVLKIKAVMDALAAEETSLKEAIAKKKRLLTEAKTENQELERLQGEHDRMVRDLSRRESELRGEIRRYEADMDKLEKLIRDIIREERAASPSKSLVNREEKAVLSNSFSANKGRLNWPVGRCIVSRKFGRQPHPVIAGVYTNNLGVGLQTDENSIVKAVFDGEVSTVASIPGLGKVVMVGHGDYYTVYAKLKTTEVTTGQKVVAGQALGRVMTADGTAELEFQIWKGDQKLDPQHWLSK